MERRGFISKVLAGLGVLGVTAEASGPSTPVHGVAAINNPEDQFGQSAADRAAAHAPISEPKRIFAISVPTKLRGTDIKDIQDSVLSAILSKKPVIIENGAYMRYFELREGIVPVINYPFTLSTPEYSAIQARIEAIMNCTDNQDKHVLVLDCGAHLSVSGERW